MNSIIDAAAGLICGILSGYGIGGGTLLLIYMTNIAGLSQAAAQSINLIYFLPTSAAALTSHFKNGLVEKKALLWAAVPGAVLALFSALAATSIDSGLLRKFFGVFLLIVGFKMLFKKS